MPAFGISCRVIAGRSRSSRATATLLRSIGFGSRRKPIPVPLLPMWHSNSASRLAFLVYAIMFAATVRAAEPHVDPPRGAAPPPGFVLAVLEVTVNREQQDEPIIALRDGASRVFVAAADLARWRLRLPDAAPTLFQGERYFPLSAFNGLVATVDEQA